MQPAQRIPARAPRNGRIGRRRGFVAAAGLTAYFAFLLSRAAFGVGGSDSSGYFNTARALAAAALVEDVPAYGELGLAPERIHLVMPLGFVPGPKPGTIAPFYPIGVPLHMAGLAWIAGWRLGPFLLSPLAAALSLLLIRELGRELGLSGSESAAAAAILGACPIFLFQALQPMSDVLATVWALAAVLAARRARCGAAWSAAAGIAAGIGVLVRPTSLLVVIPVLAAVPWRKRSLALLAAGAMPAVVVFLAYNRICYGSLFRSGYGSGGALADFAWSHFPPRFLHYVRWLAQMLPLPLAGASVCLLTPKRAGRLLLVLWFPPFLLLYCFYGPYETWWYSRYLLPAIPALILGMFLSLARERSAVAA